MMVNVILPNIDAKILKQWSSTPQRPTSPLILSTCFVVAATMVAPIHVAQVLV